MSLPSIRSTLLAMALSLAGTSALAQHIPVYPPALRGAQSGHWYNPEQSGHGAQVEILDNGRALVTWYTFDRDGRPLRLVGDGRHAGTRVEAELYEVTGGRPPPSWDGSTGILPYEWGRVSIDFDGCDTGTLRWSSVDPSFGEGSMPIARLSKIEGLRCNAEEEFGLQLSYSFERSDMDFEAVFADFPVGKKSEWGIGEEWIELPDPLYSRKGVRLFGTNHSDDLAMLIKAPVRGLRPMTRYRVELDVEIASNVPQGCVGIGGAPGEAVAVKLGASTLEPMAIQANEGGTAMWRLNIDYGQQQSSGRDAVVVGDIANSQSCRGIPEAAWELKTLSSFGRTPQYRWTDAEGTLWVFAGVDSGYEGYSEVFLTALRVRLDPRVEE